MNQANIKEAVSMLDIPLLAKTVETLYPLGSGVSVDELERDVVTLLEEIDSGSCSSGEKGAFHAKLLPGSKYVFVEFRLSYSILVPWANQEAGYNKA